MKIPKNPLDRDDFFREVIDTCFASLPARKQSYERNRHMFLYGSPPEEAPTPYNKIGPHIDTLTAFLFSADTTRFGCHLPKSVPPQEWEKVPAANEALNEEWVDSDGDTVFGQALVWAMVYASTIVKLLVRDGRPQPYMVPPECFGVYRDDLGGLDRQEAMAHRYLVTRSQLDADLAIHPNRAAILDAVRPRNTQSGSDMPEGLRRIIVTNQSGGVPPISPGNTIRGSANVLYDDRVEHIAHVDVDMVEMTELWLWDDELDDYRVVTMADGGVLIYDRQNFFLPTQKDAEGKTLRRGEHCFTHVCPNPFYGTFWGTSEVAKLEGLQRFRNERINQVRDLLAKQVNPPTVLFGMFGAVDELDFALNKAGGVLPSQDPMAKVQREKPEIPTDLWREIAEIDAMFSEASGLQNLLMGKGESGVRSGRQTSELARLGSSRIKKRALVIENALSAIGTKYWKIMRRYNADRFRTVPSDSASKPVEFVLSQMPHDTQVQVDAHSNSPLFVEDHKEMAMELFKAKAIMRGRLIEMMDPPRKAIMLRELAKIEAQEAKQAQMQATPQKK